MRTLEEQKVIQEALTAIAERNNGRLTPDAVVEEASNESSVLHGLFDWNQKTAAHSWRIEQARALIRSVRVVITTEKTSVSTVAYIRDPDAEYDEQGYVSTVSLVGDEERARTALIAEFSRAAAALRRAREIAIAFGMEGEIDAVAETVDVMRTRVNARVQEQVPH